MWEQRRDEERGRREKRQRNCEWKHVDIRFNGQRLKLSVPSKSQFDRNRKPFFFFYFGKLNVCS